jgi:ribonuclease G
MREILISRDELETRVALLEDGRPCEFYIQRPERPSLVGNIYKGRVENVLAGMDAAFVDIGLQRNGYLYVAEVAGSAGGPGQGRRKITELLRSGMEILVQVTRDGMGGKGPRLSTQLSLAGRYVVYMPGGSNSGASRRLSDEERERLRSVCRSLLTMDGGLIARTAAEGASEEAMARDLRFLQRVWSGVVRRAAAAPAPCLVYRELGLPLRAVRDLAGAEVSRVLVDDALLHRRVGNYLKAIAPELTGVVQHYQQDVPLFEAYGLEGATAKALARRVELPSGGYLVIDRTEAMTVIDVNTGRFVGKRFLEDTTLRTNLEACREIVRQLRLRDIGGIIVIDFIDMSLESNREAVLAALRAESAADRTKTYVVALSPLGLVEMTRQNVTAGLRETITTRCPTCRGEGAVLSDESAAIEVERRIRKLARHSVVPGLRVEVHPRVCALLQSGQPSRLQRIEESTGHFVVISAARETVPLDHMVEVPD